MINSYNTSAVHLSGLCFLRALCERCVPQRPTSHSVLFWFMKDITDFPDRRYKHWHACRGKNTKIYMLWHHIICRCYDKNNISYPHYGGRWITVCDRWLDSFESFYADMGERPEWMSIDRIDNNGNYEKSNCKWSTIIEQANNKTTNVWYSCNWENMTVAQWARKMWLSRACLADRIKKHGIYKAITMKWYKKKTKFEYCRSSNSLRKAEMRIN